MSNKMHSGHCDHCKEPISMGDACVIQELPRTINNADKGAYAIVCADCYVMIILDEPTETNG